MVVRGVELQLSNSNNVKKTTARRVRIRESSVRWNRRIRWIDRQEIWMD